MKQVGKLIFLWLLLICADPSSSQELETRSYTTLDGLSENNTLSLYQDRLGYFWISTTAGLNRFDGQHFQHYSIQHGLPSLFSNQIMEDRFGRLWIATRNGVAQFIRDSFYVYPATDGKRITFVHQIYENTEGKLVANTQQGQYVFNNTSWSPYTIVSTGKNDVIKRTLVTLEGEYYFSARSIYFKSPGREVRLIKKMPDHSTLLQYFKWMDHKVMLSHDSKIYSVDTSGMNLIADERLNEVPLHNFFKDSYGRWWISNDDKGILVMTEATESSPAQVLNLPFRYESYPFFYEDRHRQVWYTGDTGLEKVYQPFYYSLKIDEVKDQHQIRALIPVGEDEFILSISDGTLLHIRYALKSERQYTVLASYQLKIANDFIDNYALDADGTLWMTTRFRFFYQLHKGRLQNLSHLVHNLGQPFAREIAVLPHSSQLVVATDSILVIGNAQRLDTLFDDTRQYISFPRQVMRLDRDRLVIKTLENDIYLLTSDPEGKRVFAKMDLKPSWNRQIYVDPEGMLWNYNVGESIQQFKSEAGRLTLVENIDGSMSNINVQFHAFISDQASSLWCATSQGIQHIYKTKTGNWRSDHFIIQEISQSPYTEWFRLIETSDHIWVSLRNRLIYFDKNTQRNDAANDQVVLEEIMVNNQTTDWRNITDSVFSYFEIPFSPQLKHDQNSLTIFYNCPYTDDRQGQVFSYRLMPGDSIWSAPSANRSVSFNHLSPNQYVFQVRTRSLGRDWSAITAFPFLIHKPFWDTWWFRTLLLLVASMSITFLFRIRIRQERVKGEIKSQLLELEMRALRAQMNPHFIYNALNSIQSLVATNQSTTANRYISKFARLLRQVLENSRKSEIHINQELESLRLYVDLEQLRIDSQVEFIEVLDEEITSTHYYMPPLILQPFVENAFWHGLSSREGYKYIQLEVKTLDAFIQFTITDNGIGRKQAELNKAEGEHTSAAMDITTQRLHDFNGSTSVLPVEVEDLYSDEGLATGTRVLIRLCKKLTPG